MKPWLMRLPVVAVVAMVMGFLGLQVLGWAAVTFAGFERGSPLRLDWGTIWCLAASVVLWSCLSLLLKNQSWTRWAWWGLASPLLGCLLVMPPMSFTMFLHGYGFFAFPVGVATGIMMWAVFSVASLLNRSPRVG